MDSNLFKFIPSVDVLLKETEGDKILSCLPRSFLKEKINLYLEEIRKGIREGEIANRDDLNSLFSSNVLTEFLREKTMPRFRRVINATGVVVHTNLGRSLLCPSAIDAVVAACSFYSNLEFSLETGKRGSRYSLVEDLLKELTGAEAALVVNNNAGAVLLVLETLARGKEVIVSRGELIEIGGSFRIPDVMARSGAILKEVGATNRTHLRDYEGAINENTAALFKAHTSNYRIIGFHKEVLLEELVSLGKKYGLPVIEDLGSGNLIRFPTGINVREPTVQDSLKRGVSVVSFSGDKLLGGPQAGIILGKREYIDRIKKNPLNRALRIDKMTLAALEATLRIYKDPDLALKEIPTLNLICRQKDSLKRQALALARRLKRGVGNNFEIRVKKGTSRVGGGANPEYGLPTYLVCIVPKFDISFEDMRKFLLKTNPPLVGRVEEDEFALDVRTLLKKDTPLIGKVFAKVYSMWRKEYDHK